MFVVKRLFLKFYNFSVLVMSSSATDVEPKKAGATLMSPHKPAGPSRRLPSNGRQKTTNSSFLRDLGLTVLVLIFLSIMTLSVMVSVSFFTTGTIAFGHELHEVPKAAAEFWKDLKHELLPVEWVPRIGIAGKVKLGKRAAISVGDYASLRVVTPEYLKQMDGSQAHLPVLLSITGLVFDVSAGRHHYEVGGSYNFLAGKDATISFVTGCFDEECFKDQAVGWDAVDQNGRRTIRDWVSSYKEKYVLYGRLKGTYELYHHNNPQHEHQKFLTPVNIAAERVRH